MASNTAEKSKKILSASVFAGMVFLSSIMAVQGALLSSIISHYNLSSSNQGFATLFSSFGGMVAFVLTLLLVGRIRKTRLLLFGFSIVTVLLFFLASLPPFPVFIAIWFFAGIGLGFMDALLSSVIADLYTGPASTKIMCMLHATFGITSMVFPILCSVLLNNGFLWNHIYILIAVYGILLVGFTIFADLISGKGSSVNAEKHLSFSDFRAVLSSSSLGLFILGMLLHGFFLSGLNTWVNFYVGTTLGSSIGGAAQSFLFAGILISRLLFPYTGIEPGKYIRICGILSAVCLLAVLPFSSGLVACIGVALSGLCFGAMIPCMLNLACEDNPNNTLLTTSLMMLALYLGQGSASPVLGFFESTVGLRFGLALCAVCMVLASLTFHLKLKGRKE